MRSQVASRFDPGASSVKVLPARSRIRALGKAISRRRLQLCVESGWNV